MPLLLRKVTKPKWNHSLDLSWLRQGEMPADPMTDLKTEDNKLSMWHVEDDESNLDQVVTAIAATRDHLENVDCVLLDQRDIVHLDINVGRTAGDTPLSEANLWHCDMAHLSAQKLVELAGVMWERSRAERRLKKAVRQLLVSAVESGRIDSSGLKETLRNEIAPSTVG